MANKTTKTEAPVEEVVEQTKAPAKKQAKKLTLKVNSYVSPVVVVSMVTVKYVSIPSVQMQIKTTNSLTQQLVVLFLKNISPLSIKVFSRQCRAVSWAAIPYWA